jgi:hypothetical protein
MEQIPTDLLVSEDAVRAGLAAMEQIHGRHLGQMNPQEQEEARGHWRAQVEQILATVHASFRDDAGRQGGRAVITFSDQGGDEVEIAFACSPELREVSPDEVEGTAAQLFAISVLESLQDEHEGHEGHDHP